MDRPLRFAGFLAVYEETRPTDRPDDENKGFGRFADQRIARFGQIVAGTAFYAAAATLF